MEITLSRYSTPTGTISNVVIGQSMPNWTLNAQQAYLFTTTKSQATFSYGKAKPVINGKVYECKDKYASILYDRFNDKWETKEMKDK